MEIDALLDHYLGGGDPDDPARIEAAAQRIAIDFGVERDPGRRFALWALLLTLGLAPDPDAAFKRESERRAAHNLARMMAHGAEAAEPQAG